MKADAAPARATRSNRTAHRLLCHDFAPEEVDALRSLLRLLQGYLRCSWCIAADAPTIVLVNLDRRTSDSHFEGARVVGCALKPRLHPVGTLHRPFRAGEILALLGDPAADDPPSPGKDGDPWRYSLHGWPAEFDHLPRSALQVMAAIRRTRRTAAEIGKHTGLGPRELGEVLSLLQQMEIVDRVVERHAMTARVAAPAPGLRDLAIRVGRVLGFRT